MVNLSRSTRRIIAHRLAPWMFWLSLVFLALIGTLLVLWVDVPRVSYGALEEGTVAKETVDESTYLFTLLSEWDIAASELANKLEFLALGIWPIFIADSLFVLVTSADQALPKYWRWYRYVICLLPMLRLCPVHPEMKGRLWLPFIGWCYAKERLRRRIERFLTAPMITVAILILPVLVIEWTMKRQIAQLPWLRLFLHIGTGCIWFAFATEYILMISISRRKWEYFKSHWVDLVIIVLPLVSFLRSMQFLRTSSLARIAKLQQISKMIQFYRLRGVSMKMFRAFIVLEILTRIRGPAPEKRRQRILTEIEIKEDELRELRAQLASLEIKMIRTDTNSIACSVGGDAKGGGA